MEREPRSKSDSERQEPPQSEAMRKLAEEDLERGREEARRRNLSPSELADLEESRHKFEAENNEREAEVVRERERGRRRHEAWLKEQKRIEEERLRVPRLTPEEMQRELEKEAKAREDTRQEQAVRETLDAIWAREDEQKRAQYALEQTPEYKRRMAEAAEARAREAQERENKEERLKREQLEAANREHERLRQEKAPKAKVDALVKEKLRLELDDATSVDLTEALPALIEAMKANPEAIHAAQGLEDQRRVLDKAAEDALMYGSDYRDKFEAAVAEFRQKAYAEAKRYDVDLAGLPEAGEERTEAGPAGRLESALVEAGLGADAFEKLMGLLPESDDMVSERKMLQGQYRMVQGALEQGGADKDPNVRATIDQFVQDVKRSLERHGGG